MSKEIKDLFLPYELAVIAKDLLPLEFDEKCIAYFKPNGLSHDIVIGRFDESEYHAALLYQQIVDWLRENHKIHINVGTYISNLSYEDEQFYDFTVWVYNVGFKAKENQFGTYYQALNKSIEEAFKLI